MISDSLSLNSSKSFYPKQQKQQQQQQQQQKQTVYQCCDPHFQHIVYTVRKVSKYGVFSGPYFPVFRIEENADHARLLFWTLFTQ